jgi:PAS domain S-box-containing protein
LPTPASQPIIPIPKAIAAAATGTPKLRSATTPADTARAIGTSGERQADAKAESGCSIGRDGGGVKPMSAIVGWGAVACNGKITVHAVPEESRFQRRPRCYTQSAAQKLLYFAVSCQEPSIMADRPPRVGDGIRELQDNSFRLLVESVKDYAIFLLDPGGHIASWNAGAQRIKGYRADEIIGRHFSTFYSPDDVAGGKPDRELAAAIADGRVEDEGWRIRKDGTRFWANVLITALRDNTGTLRGFAKVTRDVTERKLAEEALRQSEEQFRLLVDRVKDYAIILLNPDGQVASWNVGAERTMGYQAAEIIGRHFSTFYPPQDVAAGKTEAELATALRDGRVEDEGWRVRKDGSQFWADTVITVLRDTGDRLRGFAKVTRDVTDRRKAEQSLRTAHNDLERRVQERTAELSAAVAELKELDRQKTDFLAMLAHELRNPLAPVRNALQILRLPNTDLKTAEWARDMIDRQVRHLAGLIDDLLDASRLTRGLVRLRRERLDLAAVTRTVAEDRRRVFEDGGLTLAVTGPDAPVWVEGDATRLTQVISNLLDNALKFTDRGGRIDLGLTAAGSQAVLTVRDSGIGITADMLPRLFDIFAQADRSLERSRGGLGLGLALVKGLIGLHRGTVTATSEGPGKGATFTIRLPLAPPA